MLLSNLCTYNSPRQKPNSEFLVAIRFIMENSVKSDMVGKWRLERRDNNFDQFLSCRNVGWFLRTLMTTTSADVEYKLSPGTFTKVTSASMGRTTTYNMPIEGDFCPAKTLSGKPENGRIFETSGGHLIQEMSFVDTGDMAAVIKHKVEDGKLIVDMQCKDIICRSVYTRL